MLSIKCFLSEISKGDWLLYKERELIGTFNWIEEYTLFSGRILISYLKLQSCSLSKDCENIFSSTQRMSFYVPSSQQKTTKTSKVQVLRKILPEVWNQIQEISCWKHSFFLQNRGSDRCIYLKGKVPQPVCSTAWEKTLITSASVAVEREACQLKRLLCKE